jgi:hypothetical protein
MVLGLQMAPKESIIIHVMELGKPYMFPKGRNSARSYDNIEGRGFSKKRMLTGNRLDRGSNFALI